VETGGCFQNVVEKITRKIFSAGSQRVKICKYNMAVYVPTAGS